MKLNIHSAIIIFFICISSSFSNDNYSNVSLIIKFKHNSSFLPQLRKITPRNLSDILQSSDKLLDKYIPVKDFLLNNFIRSIKAVKPDATLTQLPGGIERIFIVEINTSETVENVKTLLLTNPEIEYAELDYVGYGEGTESSTSIIPNDPSFSSQWGLRNTGQSIGGFSGTPGGDINAVNAWDVTTGSPNLKISILDSGIPLTHPEFSGRLLPGYDFANNDPDPTDDQGHGTNVSSIAGAKGNNSSLVAGVNWNSKIIPVKILDNNNSGFYSWWVSGITFAVDNGAKVLNMSVGGSSFSSSLQDAVTYAYSNGRIVIVCMMNNNNNVVYYPAGFSNVIAIGATNNRNQRAVPFCWGGGSSYGPHIDFTAPGELILGLVYNNPNTTSYWCGTSQATPMVTGTVSLLLSADSTLTFTQIYNALKNSARDQVGPPGEDTPGFDNYFGWGLINARGALNLVIGIQPISNIIPDRFLLHQNYPNPFNPATKIKFEIPSIDNVNKENVQVKIFDILGREIETLVNEELKPGVYEISVNASNLPSGTYFYKLSTGEFTETKKLVVVK